jgi:SAM-dependent methyltransferase
MNKCIACGHESHKAIYEGLLQQCLSCGFATYIEPIDESAISELYSLHYFKGSEYLDYENDKPSIQKNFADRLKKIKRIVNPSIITNVLEIGCAYGFFGEILEKTFPSVVYRGIDISDDAVQYGKTQLRLDLSSGDYLNYPTDVKYSDIFMWDVIEHLKNPENYLEKISTEIMPGGRLYITTGDFGSLLSRIQKKKWRLIHPPTHIHYFARKNIGTFLHQYGFRVHSIMYPKTYRTLRQIFYSLFLLNGSHLLKLKKRIFGMIPANAFVSLNTYDIMFVIAVKEDKKN